MAFQNPPSDHDTELAGASADNPKPGRFGVLSAVVLVGFGLIFAFYLYEAINQSVQLWQYVVTQNRLLARVGGATLVFPWLSIALYLALPFVGYAVAAWLGRRRRFGVRAALFWIALATVSALSLTLESIASLATRIS